MEIQYHLATVADIKTLISLRIAFLEEYWGQQPHNKKEALISGLTDYYLNAMEKDECISWLAKTGEGYVGTGSIIIRTQPGSFANPSGRVAYFMNMFTLKEHRRKGISTELLTRLSASAKEIGIHALELHATEEGEPVYIKNGFKLHPEPTYRKMLL